MTVTKGLATWVGLIGAAAAVLIPLLSELADAVDPLGVPPQTWVIVSAALAGLVVVGRMAQAIALTLHPPTVVEEGYPEEPPAAPTDVPADSVP